VLWVWDLIGVASGGTNTVSMDFTESGKTFGPGWGASFTYNNVVSVGALQTAYGDSTAATVSVPSASGNLVWGAVLNGSGTALTGFSLTERQQNTVTGDYAMFEAGDTVGASSVAVSATNSNYYWAAAGLNLVGTSSVKWNSGGAPTITTTAGAMDILSFISDGTDWYGSYSQGYVP